MSNLKSNLNENKMLNTEEKQLYKIIKIIINNNKKLKLHCNSIKYKQYKIGI